MDSTVVGRKKRPGVAESSNGNAEANRGNSAKITCKSIEGDARAYVQEGVRVLQAGLYKQVGMESSL